MRNFPTEFWKRFQDFKDAPAIYTLEDDSLQTLTYWAWTRRIQNLAMGLMEAGLTPGTRVGFLAPNGRDWLDVAVATWLVGGCIVPLVPGRDRRESLRCLGRSGCDWIVMVDEIAQGKLRGPGGQLPPHLHFVLFDSDSSDDHTHPIEELEETGRSLIRRGRTRQLAERIYGLKPQDPVLILFDPEPDDDAQGAFFSGQKIAHHLDGIARQMALTKEDEEITLASALSFGWFSSFLITAATLYAGKSIALSPTLRDLSDEVEKLRPTHLICGPAYLSQLADRWQQRLDNAPDMIRRLAGDAEIDPESTDIVSLLGSLGSVGERAARRFLYDPIREEFGGRLQAIQVTDGHCPAGLAEILDKAGIALLGHFGVPEAGVTHLEHPGAHRPNSAGRPIEGIATKIDGAKTGKTGEVLVRGDLLFDGYWAGDGPRKVDEDGWLHTGRRGRLESGFLFLEDP